MHLLPSLHRSAPLITPASVQADEDAEHDERRGDAQHCNQPYWVHRVTVETRIVPNIRHHIDVEGGLLHAMILGSNNRCRRSAVAYLVRVRFDPRKLYRCATGALRQCDANFDFIRKLQSKVLLSHRRCRFVGPLWECSHLSATIQHTARHLHEVPDQDHHQVRSCNRCELPSPCHTPLEYACGRQRPWQERVQPLALQSRWVI